MTKRTFAVRYCDAGNELLGFIDLDLSSCDKVVRLYCKPKEATLDEVIHSSAYLVAEYLELEVSRRLVVGVEASYDRYCDDYIAPALICRVDPQLLKHVVGFRSV